MDFQVSEKMATMLAMVNEFVDRELVPDRERNVAETPETVEEMVADAQVKVRQMELWAPNHPVEFGGLGLSMVEHGF